jgi:thiol-disulfide isomerase/thioredoxin
MPKHFVTLVLLLNTAVLLPGCDEQASVPAGPELISESEIPGTPITSAGDLKEALGGPDSKPVEREFPVVNADTLKALRRQASAQGKVLVIDCWATWCGSCVAMFPHLHKAIKERGDGVVLMSLSFDEGDESLKEAAAFLTKQDAWDNAYIAEAGSDAKDLVAAALSENWDGGALPAVFVYQPDGTVAYELLETRGEVQDWVDGITAAVDAALIE